MTNICRAIAKNRAPASKRLLVVLVTTPCSIALMIDAIFLSVSCNSRSTDRLSFDDVLLMRVTSASPVAKLSDVFANAELERRGMPQVPNGCTRRHRFGGTGDRFWINAVMTVQISQIARLTGLATKNSLS